VCSVKITPNFSFAVGMTKRPASGSCLCVSKETQRWWFKFLPVLPHYVGQAFNRQLPPHLAKKWRFRTEYQHDKEAFLGDGSRGGPERREFDGQERAKL